MSYVVVLYLESITEKSTDNWKAEFKEFLGSLDEDTIVTVVDCHI